MRMLTRSLCELERGGPRPGVLCSTVSAEL